MMKLILFFLLLSFSASAQSVADWSFTSLRVRHQDSTQKGRLVKRIIDTSFVHKSVFTCKSATKKITMDLITPVAWHKEWSYDSMRIKTDATPGDYAQYYYLPRKTEQDVMLVIYYPIAKKLLLIGMEKDANGKLQQIRAKYTAK